MHFTGYEPPEHLAVHDWPLFRVTLQVPLLRRDTVASWLVSQLPLSLVLVSNEVSQLPLPLVLVSSPDNIAVDHGSTQPVHEAEPGSEALPSLHWRQLLALVVRGW